MTTPIPRRGPPIDFYALIQEQFKLDVATTQIEYNQYLKKLADKEQISVEELIRTRRVIPAFTLEPAILRVAEGATKLATKTKLIEKEEKKHFYLSTLTKCMRITAGQGFKVAVHDPAPSQEAGPSEPKTR